MNTLYNVLVVGGTGLVGKNLIKILIEKEFPYNRIISTKSNNTKDKLVIKDKEIELVNLEESAFEDIDICFICASNELALKWGNYAKEKCKFVIDNSSAFRMDSSVPLIIPEINKDRINSNLISNPNCSTIQSLLVINEIKKLYSINKIIYSTYQSCSGGGKEELNELSLSYAKKCDLYSYALCDTCISQIGEIDDSRFSKEEIKMINETKKILFDYSLNIHASCIRVPVSYCHGVFIYIETKEKVDVEKIIELINSSDRLIYKKDNEILYFQEAYQSEKVVVGRIKKDLDNDCALSLFCVADNLKVGAAFNAYKIAKVLIDENYL